ncbi:hypothetical protein BC940DRAFT_369997 [Gongronella butleri]|nr:hypothetical protein BC940DRAFT_369997 [Gongronella butleri]
MAYTCKICKQDLPSKNQLEKHKHDKHVSSVRIQDGTIVRRTPNGYPCPGCDKSRANPKTLATHLREHQLSCRPILDAVAAAVSGSPSPGSSESPAFGVSGSTSHGSSASPAVADPTSPSSCAPPAIAESTSPSSSASPIDAYLSDLEFDAPNDSDAWIFQGVDVSNKFYMFQQEAKRLAASGAMALETHAQHLLALSGILVLKPGRTHPDIHKHIDRVLCDQLCVDILMQAKIMDFKFPSETKVALEEMVDQLLRPVNPISRLAVAKTITSLMQGDDFSKSNRILLAIRSLVENLPKHIVGDGPQETELITRQLQPALGRLFEDIDNDIVLRWTSVSDDEKPTSMRPDASVNVLQGAAIGDRIGVGEVKPQYQALNHRAVQKDLVRVAHLAKRASDDSARSTIFSFLVVGDHMTVYLFQRQTSQLYTLVEVTHIQLPYTLGDIPAFLGQMTKIANVVSAFDYAVSANSHTHATHPHTLTDHQLQGIVDSRTSRKRKSVFSHYSH